MREESKKQVFTREIIFGWNSILQAVVLREGTELKTRRRVKLQTICKVHFRASKIAPCLQYCTSEDAIAEIPPSLCSLRFWRAGKDNALRQKKGGNVMSTASQRKWKKTKPPPAISSVSKFNYGTNFTAIMRNKNSSVQGSSLVLLKSITSILCLFLKHSE